jgi:hypothetical protein
VTVAPKIQRWLGDHSYAASWSTLWVALVILYFVVTTR